MPIDVRALSFSYGSAPVLQNVTFRAEPGEVIAVLGPNGVGKSTLFRCLLGFLRPTSGEVLVDGRALREFSRRELAREVAYIPQSYTPTYDYTVRQCVLMGATAQLGALQSPAQAQQALTERTLESLGIAHLAERGSQRISGGERQLMLIARALVQDGESGLRQQLPRDAARGAARRGWLYRHFFQPRPQSGVPLRNARPRTQGRRAPGRWRARTGAHRADALCALSYSGSRPPGRAERRDDVDLRAAVSERRCAENL